MTTRAPPAARERHLCDLCFATDDAAPGEGGEWSDADFLARMEEECPPEGLADFAAYFRRWAERTGVPAPPEVETFIRRHCAEDY